MGNVAIYKSIRWLQTAENIEALRPLFASIRDYFGALP